MPVTPTLAFSLCLWGKTKDLHDEGGSWGGSTVAWRYAPGGPGGGRGPVSALRTHSSQQRHKHKLASQEMATHTDAHTFTDSLILIPLAHPHTHKHTLPSLVPAS